MLQSYIKTVLQEIEERRRLLEEHGVVFFIVSSLLVSFGLNDTLTYE